MDDLSLEDGLECNYWLLPRIDKLRKAVDTGHKPAKTIRNHYFLSPLDHLIKGVMAHPVSLHEEPSLIIAEYYRYYLSSRIMLYRSYSDPAST
jgi:hypothetical protein